MSRLLGYLQTLHQEQLHDFDYRDGKYRRSQLLTCCSRDALAHVVSFSPDPPCLALAAVSLKARVHAALSDEEDAESALLRISVSGETLRYAVGAEAPRRDLETVLQLSEWWHGKFRLPIEARGRAGVLATKAAATEVQEDWRAKTLYGGEKAGQLDEAVQQRLEEVTVLGTHPSLRHLNLATMANLRVLTVKNCKLNSMPIIQSLPQLTSLSIGGANGDTLDMAQFACRTALQRLTVTESSIEGPAGFVECESLVHLDVRKNRNLHSVATLGYAPLLHTIDLSDTPVSDISGLTMCPRLEVLRVMWCKELTSLAPLARFPRLRVIDAHESSVGDIKGLGKCPLLEEVHFSHCGSLTDLSPLGGAVNLRRIYASYSLVSDINGLSTCPLLDGVDLSWCFLLTSLAPLAGAPALRTIDATNSGVNSIDGLNKCPLLKTVNLRNCSRLHSLLPLAACAPVLVGLSLNGCCGVESIAPLSTAAKLRELTLCGTGVTDLSPLAACVAVLSNLRVSSFRGMRGLEVLRAAPNLRGLRAADGGALGVSEQPQPPP